MSVLSATKSATLGALNTAKSSSITDNSVNDYLKRDSGVLVTKTNTCNGNGAQLDNIFTVTGTVEAKLWAEITEATDITVFTTAYWDIYDTNAAYEITASVGTDLSGLAVGTVFCKDAAAASALTLDDNADAGVVDGVAGGKSTLMPFRIRKRTGAATNIRFGFTGDANTDVDVKFYVEYRALSADGAIAAV